MDIRDSSRAERSLSDFFSGVTTLRVNSEQALIDAGVRRVEFGTPHGLDDQRGIRLLGGVVLPLLRD